MKSETVYYSEKLYERGLSPSVSGNISVREGDYVLISPSGMCLNDIKEEDFVKIDMNGSVVEGIHKPSSEKLMHIEIYKNRPDIKAIIHSHSPYMTAFAVAGKEIEAPILPEFILNFSKIPIAKYKLPSSLELAKETAEYFKDSNAVLMQNHGIVIGAPCLKEAYYNLESIEAYCKTYIFAKFLGNVNTLNKREIAQIHKLKG